MRISAADVPYLLVIQHIFIVFENAKHLSKHWEYGSNKTIMPAVTDLSVRVSYREKQTVF